MKYLLILEQYLSYRIKLLLIFISLVALNPVFICNGHSFYSEIEFKYPTYYEMVQKRKGVIEQLDFNYDLLFEYMRLESINNKNIVISQTILETNGFTSNIFIENNNLFGMKQAMVRPTTATGTNRGHATYEHWTCSVKDYKLWYDYMTRNGTYQNYYSFLVHIGYAEDTEYIYKLRNIASTINT